ncbi:MAG: hypothetical protein AAGA97_03225, partial [Pseudomonadota bacterium]
GERRESLHDGSRSGKLRRVDERLMQANSRRLEFGQLRAPSLRFRLLEYIHLAKLVRCHVKT